jgi:hypothetical protein
LIAMPLYDFHCRSCALSTEERRSRAAKQSRQLQIAKNRDKVIAEEEYRQKHDKE